MALSGVGEAAAADLPISQDGGYTEVHSRPGVANAVAPLHASPQSAWPTSHVARLFPLSLTQTVSLGRLLAPSTSTLIDLRQLVKRYLNLSASRRFCSTW